MTPRNLMDREHRQALAQSLWDAADTLGHAIVAVEGLDRMEDGREVLRAEGEAADKVVIEGVEVGRALRTLAMRLDRAAMEKRTERHPN